MEDTLKLGGDDDGINQYLGRGNNSDWEKYNGFGLGTENASRGTIRKVL